MCKPLAKRLCLRYDMGKCSGICAQMVTPEAYAEAVQGAVALLSYHTDDIIRKLRQQMATHAEKLEFEKAQKLHLKLQTLV